MLQMVWLTLSSKDLETLPFHWLSLLSCFTPLMPQILLGSLPKINYAYKPVSRAQGLGRTQAKTSGNHPVILFLGIYPVEMFPFVWNNFMYKIFHYNIVTAKNQKQCKYRGLVEWLNHIVGYYVPVKTIARLFIFR